MSELKYCKWCDTDKPVSEFYFYANYPRSECKKCCIKKNTAYNKERKGICGSFKSIDDKRAYMRRYYAENKDKFKQYNEKFFKTHPDYLRQRLLKKKEKALKKNKDRL